MRLVPTMDWKRAYF